MVHVKNHPPSLLNFFIWVNANGLLLLLRKKDAHGRVAKCPMCIFDASGFYSSTGIPYYKMQRFFLGKKEG